MRNAGNCIYDCTHSFFGEGINPMRYTGYEVIKIIFRRVEVVE